MRKPRDIDDILEIVKDHVSIAIQRRVFDKDVAQALGVSNTCFATAKSRLSLSLIPIVINYCCANNLNLEEVLTSEG